MIIDVKQTHGNFTQKFDIYYDGKFRYYGFLGNVNARQSVLMGSPDGKTEFYAKYVRHPFSHNLPFRYLFNLKTITQNFVCSKGEDLVGSFLRLQDGFQTYHYEISKNENERPFTVYVVSQGKVRNLLIYFRDEQIALIEMNLVTVNNCDEYRLYLLDEYTEYADLFSLFILYYDNWNCTERFRGQICTRYSVEYTVSKNNTMYDPRWKERHFSDKL